MTHPKSPTPNSKPPRLELIHWSLKHTKRLLETPEHRGSSGCLLAAYLPVNPRSPEKLQNKQRSQARRCNVGVENLRGGLV